MSIPRKDSELVDWSTNANTRLNNDAAAYATTTDVANAYSAVHDAFISSYDNNVAARAAGIRSSPLASIKARAKVALLDFARPL